MSEIRQTRMLEPPGFGSWGAGWRTLSNGLSRRLCSLQSEELCAEAKLRSGLEDLTLFHLVQTLSDRKPSNAPPRATGRVSSIDRLGVPISDAIHLLIHKPA